MAALRSQMGFASGIMGYDQTKRDDEIAKMVDLGVSICRFDVWWSTVESAGKGTSNWTVFDACVNDLNDAGIEPLLMIGYTPSWARGGVGDDKVPPTSNDDYGDFCQRVVNRYKGAPYNVTYYEMWNEPNIFFLTMSGATKAQKYTAMIQDAYPKMKAEDSGCFVITGGTSPAVTTGDDIDPRDFLERMYTAGAQGYFDAVGHHPYHGPAPATTIEDWSSWSQMIIPESHATMTKPSLRELMIANGDTAKKIWATESGMVIQNVQWAGYDATEARQATILPESYDTWGTYSWAGPLCWYNYQDHNFGTDSGGAEGGYSMKRTAGTHRPTYAAYRDYAAVEDGGENTGWGADLNTVTFGAGSLGSRSNTLEIVGGTLGAALNTAEISLPATVSDDARVFNGTSDNITLAPGALATVTAFTVAAIVKRSVNQYGTLLDTHDGTNEYVIWGFDDSNRPWLRCNGDQTAPAITCPTTDGWIVIVWTKAAGTATPRFHKFVFGGAWSHENAGGTCGDPTNGNALFVCRVGSPTGRDFFGGKVALLGYWDSVLSDGNIETLDNSYAAWTSLSPDALWPMGDTPVVDVIGSADQTAITGTTVDTSDKPSGFTW